MLISICCAIMAVVDGFIQPDYAVKSAIKIVLFLICPMIYSLVHKDINLKSLFGWNKKGAKLTIILAGAVYILIVGAYFLTRDIFNFSDITKSLSNNIGVTGERFIWVALYISFINSLLEEFFFRGFAFLTLKKLTTRKVAYIFSAIVFALWKILKRYGAKRFREINP